MGLRPGKADSAAKPYPANATAEKMIERRFTRRVQFMGGMKHTTFRRALMPTTCTMVVDKSPGSWDFTSIGRR
jgi:hypothetical protein